MILCAPSTPPDATSSKAGWTDRDTRVVLVITLLGSGLRFFRLGRQSLWFDEVLTVSDAAHPFRQIHSVVLASPPLFHYLIRCMLLLFGKSDFWLRTPAAFFGVLAIPFLYRVVWHFLDSRAAFWAALFCALSPFTLAYSQELRMYSLLMLESLAALYFYERAVDGRRASDWTLFTVVSLLGLYTHNWFSFLLVCLAADVLRRQSIGQCSTRAPWTSFSVLAAGYLPWLHWLHQQAKTNIFKALPNETLFYQLRRWEECFSGMRVPSGHSWIQPSRPAFQWIGMAIWGVQLAIGLCFPGKQRPRVCRIFLIGCVLPVTLAFIAHKSYGNLEIRANRYTIIAFPAFLIAISRAFSDEIQKGRTALRFLALLGIVLWIAPLYYYFTSYQKAPWKALGTEINRNAASHDRVSFWGANEFDHLCLGYYINPVILSIPDLQTPVDLDRLFLPIRASALAETAQKLSSSWDVLAWYDSGHERLLILRRKK